MSTRYARKTLDPRNSLQSGLISPLKHAELAFMGVNDAATNKDLDIVWNICRLLWWRPSLSPLSHLVRSSSLNEKSPRFLVRADPPHLWWEKACVQAIEAKNIVAQTFMMFT